MGGWKEVLEAFCTASTVGTTAIQSESKERSRNYFIRYIASILWGTGRQVSECLCNVNGHVILNEFSRGNFVLFLADIEKSVAFQLFRGSFLLSLRLAAYRN